jgi:hypothetical protein
MKIFTNHAAGSACRLCCKTTAAALAGEPSEMLR